MKPERLHNLLFALIVGCCLGVTAWSVAAREPGGFALPAAPVSSPPLPKAAPAPEATSASASSSSAPEQGVAKNVTEQQIREGKLSKRPARYQAKVTP